MTRKCHVRFCNGGGAGDRSADRNQRTGLSPFSNAQGLPASAHFGQATLPNRPAANAFRWAQFHIMRRFL
jgi:hypothetical protein